MLADDLIATFLTAQVAKCHGAQGAGLGHRPHKERP